jgi:hypothetical protein
LLGGCSSDMASRPARGGRPAERLGLLAHLARNRQAVLDRLGNCPPGSMSMSCNKLPLCAHRLEDQIHPMCGTAPSETPAHGLRLSATAWASRGR